MLHDHKDHSPQSHWFCKPVIYRSSCLRNTSGCTHHSREQLHHHRNHLLCKICILSGKKRATVSQSGTVTGALAINQWYSAILRTTLFAAEAKSWTWKSPRRVRFRRDHVSEVLQIYIYKRCFCAIFFTERWIHRIASKILLLWDSQARKKSIADWVSVSFWCYNTSEPVRANPSYPGKHALPDCP